MGGNLPGISPRGIISWNQCVKRELLCFSGSLDAKQTFQLYRGFMELVEANELSRKTGVKRSSSYSRAELPNSQLANGTAAAGGPRESLLGSLLSTSSNSSPAVSPLTGTRLVSRNISEDATSPRAGKHTSSPSYLNGLTTESHIRDSSSSSPYSSRLTTSSSPFNRFDNTNDRVVNGSGGVKSGYADRSSDAATSYLARSRLEDATSPAARLQSLRDSYSSTMWNDSAASRSDHRLPSAGWGGIDGLATSPGLSRLTSYDADPTTELLSATTMAPSSSRYEKVMSARSRSAVRRGDSGSAAARNRITSPVAAARFAMNDLSDSLLSSAVEGSAPAPSTPFSVSSHDERMKSYAVGVTPRIDLGDKPSNAAISAASSFISTGTRLFETTMRPSSQHDTPSTTLTVSETSSPKTPTLVSGTEMPFRTEISQMPAVDKSNKQKDTEVLPTTNSSKTITVNGNRKSPELDKSRTHSVTSSVAPDYKNTENGNLTVSTSGLETTAFEAKATSLASDVYSSSETDRIRKTDADDIAGSSLSAATLNRLQAAAAAAADAVVSTAARGRMEETSSASLPSEHRNATAENKNNEDKSIDVAESSSKPPSHTTSRARSRPPSTLQEMLIPSVGQNVKSPSSSNRTNDAARSGTGRPLNGAQSSSSSKQANIVDSASKSASVKGGNAAVKSRSRTLANVRDMLMPATVPSSGGGGGRTSANVTSTSSSTTTSASRARTSSTSSTREKKPGNATPAKLSSQTSRRQASSSDAASRSVATTTDRNSTRRLPASSVSSPQTPSTPASKVVQSEKERKTANQTTTSPKQSSEAAGKTWMTVGEDDWRTALPDIIQASGAAGDDTVGVGEHTIQASPSMSSLQSEPPPTSTSHRLRKSVSGEVLSSLMRPTASSMARRGSTGDASQSSGRSSRAGYSAPTSSSASKSMSSVMSRTTSSPALRSGGESLSTSSRAAAVGTASGRTTPTGPRRTADTAAGRSSRTTNPPSTAARTPRSAATTATPGRTSTTTNNTQRGAAQTPSRTATTASSRSRNNSSSGGSSNAVSSRK